MCEISPKIKIEIDLGEICEEKIRQVVEESVSIALSGVA